MLPVIWFMIVVAASSFQSHLKARCVCWRLDLTRFNRRLHLLADMLALIATSLGELLMQGEVFVVDSIPL